MQPLLPTGALLWSLSLGCSPTPPAAGSYEGVVPPELYRVATVRLALDPNHLGFAHLDTHASTVTLAWSHFPTPKSDVGRTTESEAFTTPYCPTGIASGGRARIYVGGTRADGTTVIESWTFELPARLADRAEAFQRVAPRSLYEANVVGRTHVAQLAPTVGFPGVLVQYHDSRDLWIYRESTATWTRAASPLGGAPLAVPELGKVSWTALGAQEHKTLGAMYRFRSDSIDHCLVIWDEDKNGVLDRAQLLDAEAWAAGGFADPDSYVPRE